MKSLKWRCHLLCRPLLEVDPKQSQIPNTGSRNNLSDVIEPTVHIIQVSQMGGPAVGGGSSTVPAGFWKNMV